MIAIHTEYDSNPDNSQAPGVAEQSFIVEGAPGHCEGHNVNGTVLVAGALAAKSAMDKFGLKGTLKVFGAPAEEQLVQVPEPALQRGSLGGAGRGEGVRVDAAEREVPEREPHVSVEPLFDLLDGMERLP